MSKWNANGVVFAAGLSLTSASAFAAATPARLPELPTVQVTATATPHGTPSTPAAISVLDAEALRDDKANAALSEKLGLVPGVLARQRNNFAQDEQVSIRGFGARATFGIRGVRLFLDGIPATMPDGQGQLSHLNLGSLGRIEVLRGPFSALYGNAAGGVVHAFTADGRDAPGFGVDWRLGAHGMQRAALSLAGGDARRDYRIDLSHLRSDGYRQHSRAERDSLNGKLEFDLGDRRRLRLVFNGLSAPDTEDPLGLNAAQMADDPRQATAAAQSFNTRKSVRQAQVGALLETPMSDNDLLRWMVYGGERRVTQFLAVPVAAQANPLSGGGVVGLHSPYRGMDLRWEHHSLVHQQPVDVVIGVSVDRQDQQRRGFENFVGDQLGVRGRLRRDEDNRVSSDTLYAQFAWQPSDVWYLYGGLRRTRVRFRSRDEYVTPDNPDDSGAVEFDATTPVFGASVRLRPGLHLYASVGRGLETPTFDELGYRTDGSAGLNFALRPSRSHSQEFGLKLDRANGAHAELALFRADTRDELAVASNSGGRSTYHNVGRARREGLELSADWPLAPRARVQAAYTWLHAWYRDDFLTCASSPCVAPTALAAGTAIPGLPRSALTVSARVGEELGWYGRFTAQALSAVPVANIGGQRAAGFAVFGASLGYAFAQPRVDGRWFVALENAFDRHYAGSVIVNESNGRYFEPAAGRTWLLGLELRRHQKKPPQGGGE